MTAGGGQGGFPATPSSTLGRPRTASSFKELFSLRSKAFEPLAVPGAPACFPGSECGVTPLPQFPRPYEPPSKPQPAAARVKFRFLPTHPGWVVFCCFTTLASQRHNQRFTTLARKRGCHLAGKNAPGAPHIPRVLE